MTIEGVQRRVRKHMKDDFEGRVERWAYLYTIDYRGALASPSLAYWYYNDARYCWYHGNFVATILLSQTALGEQLRNHFYVLPEYQRDPSVNLEKAGFAELIDYALRERYVTPEQAKLMHHLRCIRNPYVHSKRKEVTVRITDDNGGFTEKSLDQNMVLEMKMRHSAMLETNVEDDAREAIRILCYVFIGICLTWSGM